MTEADRGAMLREIEKLRSVPPDGSTRGVRIVAAVTKYEGEQVDVTPTFSFWKDGKRFTRTDGNFQYTSPFVDAMIVAGAEPEYDGSGRLVRLCGLEVQDRTARV